LSKTRRAFKYRLYPTRQQQTLLGRQFELCRELYNAALTERREAYRMVGKSINYFDQANQLKEIRQLRPDFCAVNFSACQEVLRRLDKAFKAFFERIKRGEKSGFPRYKAKTRYTSVTWPSYGDGCKLKASGLVYLQGIGNVRFKQHRNIQGQIKTVTIERDSDNWYVVFSCQYEFETVSKHTGPTVGIDVGLEYFANLSNGEQVANPRFFRKSEKRLAKAQRKLSALAKTDPKRRKARVRVAKANLRIRNQRHDFAHKLSRTFVSTYSLVAVEDLNIKGLAGGMLAKSVNDAAWSLFIGMLEYKAAEAGSLVLKVDPRHTSQTCPDCGNIRKKELSERWHECSCGSSMPRDVAAARVILSRGLATVSNQPVEAVCASSTE
jgi:putative transposase